MKSVFLDSFINRHFWLSYARIRVIFTASSKADDIVRLTRITAETYKPKFHCRRQSGMNFGYVTENGVNSNDIRNPLRYLLMNAVTSRPAFKSQIFR